MTTTGSNEVIRHADADAVAEALAGRLTARLASIQGESRVPQVALTGGRIATKAYQRLAAEGATSAVDWARVELWWGDERFVAADDDDRNDHATLQVLRAALPLDDARIHQMPASDDGLGLDAAAEAYAAELSSTVFDVCLLGMGPDGHVASVFPGHPSSAAPGRVIAVRNSPKPPPDRISLTLEVINQSREVWFLVAGSDKAAAAKQALERTQPPVPAAGVSGVERTVWLIDEAAAAHLSG
ncbi:MAG TPA: 6-phosphogluconolactonase [Propionibacteriaceae bacterium]